MRITLIAIVVLVWGCREIPSEGCPPVLEDGGCPVGAGQALAFCVCGSGTADAGAVDVDRSER